MCFGVISTIVWESRELWNYFLISLGGLLERFGL
jgi:hypothetical protein